MPSRVAKIAVCACLGGLGGCAGSRAVGFSPAAGGSWAAVLPGARVTELNAERGRADWVGRRNDRSLNPRSFGPVLASTEWPEPDRPSLRRPVFVRIEPQPYRFIYFRTRDHRDRFHRDW